MGGNYNRRNKLSVDSSVGNTVRQATQDSGKVKNVLSPEMLASMTKDQLKAECRRRGQKASGNKIELLSRLGYYKLTAAVSNTPVATAENQTENTTGKKAKNKRKNGSVSSTLHNKDTRKKSIQMELDNGLVLWKRPFTTLEYFGREMYILLSIGLQRLLSYKKFAISMLVFIISVAITYNLKGPHQDYVQNGVWHAAWWAWWVILGILSSVGLGTGLHTFLLYLGPHIAKVTLAAYECGSLNFPQPPYPNDIICPDKIDPRYAVSIWNIMAKVCFIRCAFRAYNLIVGIEMHPKLIVRIECMMWGLGTALGELPPYFMARAARLSSRSGQKTTITELEEVKDDGSFTARAKIGVQKLVEKVGFLGILACASIPNPLFDLAGLTCGHFLVPFWTFFGATLIGKAIIKMHLQKMFVIIAFNEVLVGQVLGIVEKLPIVGPKLEEPILEFLRNQKSRLHKNESNSLPLENQGSILSSLLEKFVLSMVVYFVVSIINSLAQNYQKRIGKGGKKIKKAE